MGFGIGFGSISSSGGGVPTSTYYTVDIPYSASYIAGTVFSVVISGITYRVILPSSQTPDQVASLLTALGKGTWMQSHVGTNTHFVYVPSPTSLALSSFFVITGGNTWIAQVSGTSDLITSVYFVDNFNGWLYGFVWLWDRLYVR